MARGFFVAPLSTSSAFLSQIITIFLLIGLFLKDVTGLSSLELWNYANGSFNRFKRDAGNSAAEKCIFKCLKDMTESKAWNINANANGRVMDSELLNKQELDKFCNTYREGKTCMDECGQTKNTHLAIATFSPFDYLCITHYPGQSLGYLFATLDVQNPAWIQRLSELIGHLKCFKESEPYVKATCDSKCGGSESVKRLQQQQQAAISSGEFRKLARIMGQMCQQMDCETECQQPVIEEVCRDTRAALFMRTFAQESLRPLQQMVEKLGGRHLWPSGCKSLTMAAPGLPFGPPLSYLLALLALLLRYPLLSLCS